MSRIGGLRYSYGMLNYAFISLRGASTRSAAKRAGELLAETFPGSRACIVDEGRTTDGAEWLAVRFEPASNVPATKCLHAYSAALHEHGVAFWRVMPERARETRKKQAWHAATSAA